jgi:predicted phosphoribosyltransferase
MTFDDRESAGKLLAKALRPYYRAEIGVGGLLRGGIVVAAAVAAAFKVPLYPIPVRKIRTSGQPELARGAVALGITALDPLGSIEDTTLPAAELGEICEIFSSNLLGQALPGQGVILIDDGIATGWSLAAAIGYVRKLGYQNIIAAAPVAAPAAVNWLKQLCEALVVLAAPPDFQAVGQYYRDFSEVTTARVKKILEDHLAKPEESV